MSITHQVFIAPSAIAVGLAEEQVVLCIEVLERAGLKVHRADPEAACEQMTKLLPQIVVVPRELDAGLREMIDDRAVAVGAFVAELSGAQDFASIEKTLDEAVAAARAARGRKPRSA
jgi:molybdate-binding protein